MKMGERLKAARKALKLNQEELGKGLGVSKAAVSMIENGTNRLTEPAIMLLHSHFRINPDWLRSGEGEMFVTLTQAEKLAEWAGETLGLPLDHPRVRAWCMLAEMPDETLAVVMAAIDRCHAAEKSEAENKGG